MNDLLTFIICCLSQVILFYYFIFSYPSIFTTTAKRSWILTLLASILMSLGSIYLISGLNINSLWNSTDISECLWTRILAIYFQSYTFTDLTLGLVYYPKEITKVTGYLHHTLYFITLYYILSWNAASLFVLVGFEEIPTIILGCGHLFKSQRRDLLFGFVFFTTRILLHAIFIVMLYMNYTERYYIIALGVFPLNLYWFYKWVAQQLRMYNKYLQEIQYQNFIEDVEMGLDSELQIKQELYFLERAAKFDQRELSWRDF